MKSLTDLLAEREKLCKKREVERSVADSRTIAQAEKNVQYWKTQLSQVEANSSISVLEEQLKKAKQNLAKSIFYHTTRLKSAEEGLRLAQLGENKRTQKLTAEIDLLDKDIAIAKLKETGDASELDNLIQNQMERSKKFLASLSATTPASATAPLPPDPPSQAVSAAPPPPPPPTQQRPQMILTTKKPLKQATRTSADTGYI